jgi:RHS repeat-associated protein
VRAWLAAMLLSLPLTALAQPQPDWISASPLISNDGFATLRWSVGGTDSITLFRITQGSGAARQVSYVDRPELQLYRIEPGTYVFRVQACTRLPGGYPQCGKQSRALVLTVNDAANERSSPAPVPSALVQTANAAGGPDQLRPGLWHNPARSGHGWSFYWANRLALPESDALHGYEYDLVGFWYTYEAKVRYRDGPPSCEQQPFGPDCYWVYLDYRPVLAHLQLIRVGPDTYEGGIFITRNGVSVEHGSATVRFGADNVHASIDWNASFKLQALGGSDAIELLAGGNGSGTADASHYAGLWSRTGSAVPVVAADVGSSSEAVEVLFSDAAGDPGWIQASNAFPPVASVTDLCFYYVQNGYAPNGEGTVLFHQSGCDPDQPVNSGNRNGRREFTDFEQGHIWLSYTLPGGNQVQLGTAANPVALLKQADFHRIHWTYPGGAFCAIDATDPDCSLELTWFTDGDYPQATAFVHELASGSKSPIPAPAGPAVVDHPVLLQQPGSYRFELHMGTSSSSTVIARSSIFTVTEATVAAPQELGIAWTDQSALRYRVSWTHPAPAGVDHYELEETPPGSMPATVLNVAPGTLQYRDFDRLPGPFGVYAYRIRACAAAPGAGQCSAWTNAETWNVADPGGPSGEAVYPWGDHANGVLYTNANFHYAMGYHFRPEVDGQITELGGFFSGAKTVKLFEFASGALLGQATVSSSYNWAYASITPVAVTAGVQYTVAAYMAGSGVSYYRNPVLPATHEQVNILGSTYAATGTNPNARPTNLLTTTMWGQADIGFVAGAVEPPNRPPVFDAAPGPQSGTEGQAVSLQIAASDPDGDALSYSDGQTLPPGLAIDATGLIQGTLAAGSAAGSPYAVEITVSDGIPGHEIKSTFNWTVTQSSSFANPEAPPAPAGMPSMTPSASASRVGATAGAFRVDETGNATYRIPLFTAPGSGGMAPQLSLEYSSQGGNGPLGVGWSLGGSSAITRCAQSLAVDGQTAVRGITLTSTDRFCLDGQRLVAVSGAYGAAGTEYRTEIDGITRVVSNGRAGTGPQSFTAWRKDGSITEYGATADSRIEARAPGDTQTVLLWLQNRASDSAGNYIDYQYEEISGAAGEPFEFVLRKVSYTGNTHAATAPYAQFDFIYDSTRSDTSVAYVRGSAVKLTRRLTRIDSRARVQAGSALQTLRSYLLAYATDGHGRQALASVTECRDSTRTYCFTPTTFGWQTSKHEVGTSATTVGGVFDSKHAVAALADISGDGRPDLLLTKKQDNGFTLRIATALAGGGFGSPGTAYPIPNNGNNDMPVSLHVIDLDADGFQDIVYPTSAAWKARLSTGTGLGSELTVGAGCCGFSNPPLVRVMDFDGDGLSDLVTVRASGGSGSNELVLLRNRFTPADPLTVGFAPAQVLTIDLGLNLFPESSPDGWVIDVEAPQFDNPGISHPGRTRPFDYNGDGAVDLLVRLSQRYVRCTGSCDLNQNTPASGTTELGNFVIDTATTGAGEAVQGSSYARASFFVVLIADAAQAFTMSEVVATGHDCTVAAACDPYAALPQAGRALPVDINADGLADFAWMDPSYDWKFRRNTGAGLLAEAVPIANFNDFNQSSYSEFRDLTGDGYPEFIYPSAIGSNSAVWMLHQNRFGASFTAAQNSQDSFGNSAEFDQSLLLDFSGDGLIDNLFVNRSADGSIQSSSTRLYYGRNSAGGSSTAAINVVSTVSDGFGASTSIRYRPLTDPAVYTRMRDARNALWGGGAVVYDLIAPIHVVSQIESTAPTFASAGSTRRVEYHYVGAKLQGGGRGFLGFGEIISYDPQSGIRSNTRYRQDFPFIGLPADSTQALVSSGQKFDRISNPAATSPVSWGAVTAATAAATLPSSTRLSYTVNQWQAIETVSGAATWFPHIAASLERSYTLSGTFSRKVLTSNTYNNGYGNLDTAVVRTYASDGATAVATRTASHTYFNDPAKWHLGRLATSAVTHARGGKASITRSSSFGYDSASGILNRETVEPGHAQLEVNTTYQLDAFGNRIVTRLTGAGMPARTSSAVYDALGRYVDETRNAYDQVTTRVTQRDAFGNVLQSENIDGVVTIGAADHMGRPFISWTETGAWNKATLVTGSGSYCPGSYTAYHTLNTGGGQPAQYACFDRLGREVRMATQGFDGTLINVDTRYDANGRVARVSEPYFSGGTVLWSETAYDAVGRISAVQAADSNDMSYDYDGAASLCATPGAARQVRSTNGLGQQQLERQNALGETVEVIDNRCGSVTYDYDAVGNLVELVGADGVDTVMSYDLAGRKTGLNDADKGYWQYAYNALGEMTRQLDGKNQAIDFSYDLLGRVTIRYERTGVSGLSDNTHTTVNSETTAWINSTSSGVMGKSQAASITYRVGTAGAIVHQHNFTHDEFGRSNIRSSSQDGLTLAEETTYDQFGRVFQQFDASGDSRGVRYHYNDRGFVEKLQEAREGTQGVVYQRIQGHDERGNVTYMVLGNGVEAFAEYEPSSGRLQTLEAYDAQGVELQRADYRFDVLGNLRSRHDTSQNRNLNESFDYDALNRLKNVMLAVDGAAAQTTLSLQYDASGNIIHKSDVGSYLYAQNGAGAHAVTSAGGNTYGYDANGNQVSSSDGRTISYTVFDQAARVEKAGESTEFLYGIGNQRIRRVDDNTVDENRVTWYFGSVERIRQNSQNAFFKRYLGGVAIADYFPATENQSMLYLVTDHLGSIHTTVNESGLVSGSTSMDFGPFGERRSTNWSGPLATVFQKLQNVKTTRGFTGHEHADGLGIIHMNGRIYDPRLGRFLQADPFVQAPKNSQSLNRYSYVLNNPLGYTDPSGYFSLNRFIKKWWRVIVATVVSYVTYGAASEWAAGWALGTGFGATAAPYVGAVIGGAVAGFVGGTIIAGTLKGAFHGAAAGALLGGVAAYFGDTYSLARIVADSLAGGIAAEINGQRFRNGLLITALVSTATYVTVQLRKYEIKNSSGTPGQIGDSPGFRGVKGKLGGGRFEEQLWNETGRRVLEAGGNEAEAFRAYADQFEVLGKRASPLGCHQGGPGCLFSHSYDPGGFVDYIVEGFAGPHDFLNHPIYYNANGTLRALSGFQRHYGQFQNVANVFLVAPVVIPALLPDQMRFLLLMEVD